MKYYHGTKLSNLSQIINDGFHEHSYFTTLQEDAIEYSAMGGEWNLQERIENYEQSHGYNPRDEYDVWELYQLLFPKNDHPIIIEIVLDKKQHDFNEDNGAENAICINNKFKPNISNIYLYDWDSESVFKINKDSTYKSIQEFYNSFSNNSIIDHINKLKKSNVHYYMEDFEEIRKSDVISDFVEVNLKAENNKIELDTLWVHGETNKGYGTQAMQQIIKLADKHQVELTLSSSPLRYDEEYCTDEEFKLNDQYLNNDQLITFYKKFGFVFDDNFKQSNTDNPEQPRMIRKPIDKPTQSLKIK